MIDSPGKTLLTKRMELFLRAQSVCCKKSTLGAYRISLKHFVQFTSHRGITLRDLRHTDLADFLCEINELKLAPYTKLNYFINVRKYLAWECDQGRIDEKILTALDRKKLPKIPEYLPRPLSSETDAELKRRCEKTNSPYALLFLLLRQTGLRISELINLPFDPVVTNNGEAFLKVPLGKMNTERMLPLSEQSLNLIRKIQSAYPIRLNCQDKRRLIGLKGPVPIVAVLLRNNFKKLTGDLIDQEKPVTFHRLRHTYATTLMSAGVSIVSIMKLLGHRRIGMSLRYAKVTPSHLREEYLRAIAVIENQAGIRAQEATVNNAVYDPVEIIEHLRAFTNRSVQIAAPRKKKLLRKLACLKADMSKIAFDKDFKITTVKIRGKRGVD